MSFVQHVCGFHDVLHFFQILDRKHVPIFAPQYWERAFFSEDVVLEFRKSHVRVFHRHEIESLVSGHSFADPELGFEKIESFAVIKVVSVVVLGQVVHDETPVAHILLIDSIQIGFVSEVSGYLCVRADSVAQTEYIHLLEREKKKMAIWISL